jgi:transposase
MCGIIAVVPRPSGRTAPVANLLASVENALSNALEAEASVPASRLEGFRWSCEQLEAVDVQLRGPVGVRWMLDDADRLVSMERPAPVRIYVGHPHWAGGANIRKEPAVASVAHRAPIHLGLDVHRDTISVGILLPDQQVPEVDRIAHDEASIRRLVGRLGDRSRLRACYEAGPTGYDLARLLSSIGVSCQVIAPSLIPTAPGDRVKTDARDCRRLARLHRAGELVAIRIPTPTEEAVRDLCRTRADMVADRTRARHRLSKFLLRHGRIWRGGVAWTQAFDRWLASQRFDEPALTTTFRHYRAVLEVRDAQLDAIEDDLALWQDHGPFADQVARLAAYRGVTRLGGLTLASEVGDWRRFPRASAFMGFCGLVPSEYSSGTTTRRGTSPEPATPTCAPSWSSRLGPTSTGPAWAPPSPPATKDSTPRSSLGRGRPSCACAAASGAWPPARRPRTWSPPRSPASSPGSCGAS